uniref:Putative translation initiation factor-3 n=1 Tax=Corethrella appendiculata TaxID=1370023 RepID=U5EQP9_9DIPT
MNKLLTRNSTSFISHLINLNQKINNVKLISTSKFLLNSSNSSSSQNESATKPDSKKKQTQITLILPGDSVEVCTLEIAQKISKRRDLKLVKIVDLDTKSERPIYKLMTASGLLNEELKRREERRKQRADKSIKGEKLLSLTSRITEHDLNSKIQMAIKWLQKLYEVRVIILGDTNDSTKQEKISKMIETSTSELGNIVQKREKHGTLRFQILPKIEKENNPTPSTSPVQEPIESIDNQTRSFHTDTKLSSQSS